MLAKKIGGERMANQEHLAILKRGVETWNQWRREHPNMWPGPDLSNADLFRARLSKANLNQADLSHANLSHATLSYADLGEANLMYANLGGTWLDFTDLRGTRVTDKQLAQASSLHGTIMPDGSKHP
jgi:uncharacterized protein YjbI with pentapeptide repeats